MKITILFVKNYFKKIQLENFGSDSMIGHTKIDLEDRYFCPE